MSNFRAIDRKTGYLLPPSVDEWLPEKHLARFIVDVIDGLDLGRMSRAYRGTGSASYHPRTLLSILVYESDFDNPQTTGRCTDSSSSVHALDQTQSVPEGHCRKSQTATVTPAKPGDYPFYLMKTRT